MTTQTYNTKAGLVKEMRKIRNQISMEIKDMTFEEERAYLDKLLTDKSKIELNDRNSSPSGLLHNEKNQHIVT